jgi:4-amino-4-deoxy-L-arabinose transferase-like glycosyltransferase
MPIAYGVLNSIFWVLSATLMYDVTLRVTSSRQQALAAALLFTTSPPTLLYFGSVMLEAGGTFFSLLILWTYLRLQDRLNRLGSLLAGALVGVGILSREATLPVVVTILLLGMVARRIKRTFIWVLSLIIPSAMWQCYTTLIYGENYWTHYVRAGLGYSRQLYGTSFYIDAVDLLKALAWAHFPLAAICLIVGFLGLDERRKNLTFYCLLLPALGAYLLWPYRHFRIGVVTYYATMPLAGMGLDYIVGSLKQKPLIGRLGPKAIWTGLLLIHIVASMTFAHRCLGAFSPPWSVYTPKPLP